MLLDTARPSSLAEENASTTGVSAGRRSLASDLDDSMMFGGDVDLDGEGGDDDDGFIQQLASSPRTEQLTQATAPAPKPVQRKAAVGGNDALGRKENKLLQWKQEMVEVASAVSAQFEPLGLHFRPQILLATALQEADAKDPLNAVSFDKGLGIMQITPYKGKLDPAVAKAINWDNSKSVSENIKTSNWRNAKANLMAGAMTMLTKAKAIKRSVASTWEKMDEPQRWRAVLYAYNAGEGSAIKALKAGGPNARMISTYTDPKGRRVSHDYTKEFQEKFDYVDSHDPFDGESTPTTGETGGVEGPGGKPEDKKEEEPKQAFHLVDSVGRGGKNRKADVSLVQDRLTDRGVNPGKVDGLVGPPPGADDEVHDELRDTDAAQPAQQVAVGLGMEVVLHRIDA
ncbi:MAG TPA: transglycosylase SLT domain-containing protein, partial [Kofleriaceae bacterium]|nr:transglycosylase SLT domain-containing protein [Kofleriaceae bacterium]